MDLPFIAWMWYMKKETGLGEISISLKAFKYQGKWKVNKHWGRGFCLLNTTDKIVPYSERKRTVAKVWCKELWNLNKHFFLSQRLTLLENLYFSRLHWLFMHTFICLLISSLSLSSSNRRSCCQCAYYFL